MYEVKSKNFNWEAMSLSNPWVYPSPTLQPWAFTQTCRAQRPPRDPPADRWTHESLPGPCEGTPKELQCLGKVYVPGTLNNQFLMDVWWFPTNHFQCINKWMFQVPGRCKIVAPEMDRWNTIPILSYWGGQRPTFEGLSGCDRFREGRWYGF